jgi:hypothetical protein
VLRKYNIKLGVIIVILAAVLILPFNSIAQNKNNKLMSKAQSEKKPPLQKKQIGKTIKPSGQLSVSTVLSKKIVVLEGELSRIKTALSQAAKAGGEKDKYINKLTLDIKGLQGLLVDKTSEIVFLDEEVKGFQALVNEKDSESVELKHEYEKNNNVITCYRTALTEWDKNLRRRVLTEQDRLTISTELRRSISGCPPI